MYKARGDLISLGFFLMNTNECFKQTFKYAFDIILG